jgi:hypothetical protein
MSGITSLENVNDVSSLGHTRNCKDESSGVATQKAKKRDVKKVRVLVHVIYDIMKIYGYRDYIDLKGDFSKMKSAADKLKLEERISSYVCKTGLGSWKDFFKYKINAYFSWVMGQEIPPIPKGLEEFPDLLDPSFLCFGRGKRFLFNMRSDRLKLESFAQSIAQSKKGAPAVSVDAVLTAELACHNWLTSAHKDMDDFEICNYDPLHQKVWVHPINRDSICYQLRRTVREVFSGKRPTWEELTRPFVPSTSSQYNFSRGGMGAVGAFLENEVIMNHNGYPEGYNLNDKEDPPVGRKRDIISFISKSLGPVSLKKELTELYGKAGVEDQERIDHDFENIMVKNTIGLHFNGEELCKLWKNSIYPNLVGEALKEQPRTIVIGLPEPLKVRCITAGPPLTYTVLKPVQKWLWKTLKDESVFKLIGTPVTSEIVFEQLGKLGSDEEFVSGDYKASTDNLHSWVSECLLDELINLWREDIDDEFDLERINQFEVLMKRALTGHLILNPIFNVQYRKDASKIKDEDFLPQQEGQLMGSIISFPFLCLANAALCRYAMEITDFANYKIVDRPIKGYETARLLINGDDCVFPGKVDILFSNWKLVAGFGGLESSVGKTFKSRKFLTINSCQYSYRVKSNGWEDLSGSDCDYSYEEIQYVNMGLVYGQKKDGSSGKPFYRMGAIHRDLKRTCPAVYFDRATDIFLKRAKETKFRPILDFYGKPERNSLGKKIMVEDFFGCIKNSKVPYYIPEWLGGLGLVPNGKSDLSRWDLKAAAFIRSNMSSEWAPKSLMDKSVWAFHSLVQKSLKDYEFLGNQNYSEVELDGTTRTLQEEYQKLYTLSVVDMLLNQPSKDIYVEFDDSKEETVLRKHHASNALMWKSLRTECRFVGLVDQMKPIEVSDLSQEKKGFSLSCFDVRI